MEDGPVVPDVEGAQLGGLGHVGDHPADPPGTLAEPGLCLAEGGLRDVEDRDFPEGEVEEPVDQERVLLQVERLVGRGVQTEGKALAVLAAVAVWMLRPR